MTRSAALLVFLAFAGCSFPSVDYADGGGGSGGGSSSTSGSTSGSSSTSASGTTCTVPPTCATAAGACRKKAISQHDGCLNPCHGDAACVSQCDAAQASNLQACTSDCESCAAQNGACSGETTNCSAIVNG